MAEVSALKAELAVRDARITELEATVATLKPSGRKRGGQKGHRGRTMRSPTTRWS